MKEMSVIGAGPGDKKYILPAAIEAVKAADIVIGDRRLLAAFDLEPDGKHIWAMDGIMAAVHEMAGISDEQQAAVLVSGDPAFYSMLDLLKRTYPDVPVKVIPGLSTFSIFAAAVGETLADAKLTSAHGRDMTEEKLIELVRLHGKVFLLCDSVHDPSWMAETLCRSGMSEMTMAVGSRLTYPEERIQRGKASDFADAAFPGMSVVMIKDQTAKIKEMTAPVVWTHKGGRGWLRDTDFIRNKTPMTAEELRWIIMGKLQLRTEEIFWDIGAGTGSISVEAALHLNRGHVYAFERNKTALEVLARNREKFCCDNLTVIEGEAPEALAGVPAPDAVFIGGAGRKLSDILTFLVGLHKKIRIIIPAVTIETQSEAFMQCAAMQEIESPKMMTVSIGRSRQLGTYHMIEQGHNVSLIMTEIKE